jgi:tetratricopeptide (TPR) repeat protein
MDSPDTQQIRERLAEGRSLVIQGRLPHELPLPEGVIGLRVRCDTDSRPLGPLRELSLKAARLLGEPEPGVRAVRLPSYQGAPRHRLLGFTQEPEGVGAIVARLQRLVARAPRGVALVFDDVTLADEGTLTVLRRLIENPDVLHVPIVLGLGGRDPAGESRALIEALVAREGPHALVEAWRSEAPRGETTAWRDVVRGLGHDELMTLRAAAVAGTAFDLASIAALRDLDELRVLEHLQRARDGGAPIEDTGENRFRMPDAMADSLREGVLPSLARAWHRRLADRLSAPPAEPSGSVRMDERARATPPAAPQNVPVVRVPPPPPAHSVAEDEATVATVETDASASLPANDTDPPVRTDEPEHRPRHRRHAQRGGRAVEHAPPAEIFTRTEIGDGRAPTGARPKPATTSVIHDLVRPPRPAEPDTDGVRAARHLAAVGDLDGAARQLLAAAREAVGMGLPLQALTHGRNALAMLAELPVTPSRRRLRAEILLMLGTTQWQASGPGPDFSLKSALETLLTAQETLGAGDPAGLRGAIAATLAGVCGDLGDVRALETALSELSEVTRALQAEGASIEAARLLNDQAALHLRGGDPVKAAWLLDQAREVFEQRIESMDDAELGEDPSPLIELAETEHLYARLPLHAAARPGRETDALGLGREHGIAALEIYRKLGDEREVARVQETLARLELRAGRLRHAEERLQEALQTQESLGDVLGLARSTAVLAEVCARNGRHDEALRRLSDSVAFNLEKGSSLGVVYNRRALERIAETVGKPVDPALQRAFEDVAGQIRRAEAIVGGTILPPDE